MSKIYDKIINIYDKTHYIYSYIKQIGNKFDKYIYNLQNIKKIKIIKKHYKYIYKYIYICQFKQ